MVLWQCKIAGKEYGPFTADQLKQLATESRLAVTDLVKRTTDSQWSPASKVKGLFPETVLTLEITPELPPVQRPPQLQPPPLPPNPGSVVETNVTSEEASRIAFLYNALVWLILSQILLSVPYAISLSLMEETQSPIATLATLVAVALSLLLVVSLVPQVVLCIKLARSALRNKVLGYVLVACSLVPCVNLVFLIAFLVVAINDLRAMGFAVSLFASPPIQPMRFQHAEVKRQLPDHCPQCGISLLQTIEFGELVATCTNCGYSLK